MVTTDAEIVKEFSIIVWQRILEIVNAPLTNKEMLFTLIPLITVLFVIELYFGRYKYEKLGWNTAVGNSLALFFVGMNLLDFLYTREMLFVMQEKTIVAFIVVVESVFLLIINFFHIAPKEFAFGITSPLILNFIGSASIIIVYSDIPIDQYTFVAFFALFIALILTIKFLQSLEPTAIPKTRVGKDIVPIPEEIV